MLPDPDRTRLGSMTDTLPSTNAVTARTHRSGRCCSTCRAPCSTSTTSTTASCTSPPRIHERWAIDPTVTRTGFMVAFRAVSQECADQPFYLMRDVICRALERLIVSSGHSATRNELLHLEQLFWTAAIPTATPTDGAIETLTRLRDVGIRTGIVSYADITVFEALLKLTGLAGSTDVEVCSETARSCKPHPAIFHQALCSVGVDPTEAMFVGDTVDTDIVGGNRIGMRTALLSAREFTSERVQRRPGVTSRPPHRPASSTSSTSPSTTGPRTVLLDHR